RRRLRPARARGETDRQRSRVLEQRPKGDGEGGTRRAQSSTVSSACGPAPGARPESGAGGIGASSGARRSEIDTLQLIEVDRQGTCRTVNIAPERPARKGEGAAGT